MKKCKEINACFLLVCLQFWANKKGLIYSLNCHALLKVLGLTKKMAMPFYNADSFAFSYVSLIGKCNWRWWFCNWHKWLLNHKYFQPFLTNGRAEPFKRSSFCVKNYCKIYLNSKMLFAIKCPLIFFQFYYVLIKL